MDESDPQSRVAQHRHHHLLAAAAVQQFRAVHVGRHLLGNERLFIHGAVGGRAGTSQRSSLRRTQPSAARVVHAAAVARVGRKPGRATQTATVVRLFNI